MSEFLELKTRKKIYKLISKNPGLHLSMIADLLNMRISLVEYHLSYLEKNELIVARKEQYYKRYYVKDRVGTRDKKVMALLRQEMPLRIVLFLASGGACTYTIPIITP